MTDYRIVCSRHPSLPLDFAAESLAAAALRFVLVHAELSEVGEPYVLSLLARPSGTLLATIGDSQPFDMTERGVTLARQDAPGEWEALCDLYTAVEGVLAGRAFDPHAPEPLA